MVSEPQLRIVFFGTPEFAVPSLAAVMHSGHRLVAVVSQPDRPKGRGHQIQFTSTKTLAEAHGHPVLQPAKIRDEAFLQQIRDLRPDLPRYRGAAPIQRAVLAGDAETGVTIMRVATELDAGPTFAMAAVPIPPDATSGEMEGTLAHLGARLLLPVVDDLAVGRAVETPQDHALATHAAKITKAEGSIDWTEPAAVVHNKVRGLQPWPTPEPGTVLRAEGDELIVACGGGTALRVLEIQPEGRRTMTAREFLAGRGAAEGNRFEP